MRKTATFWNFLGVRLFFGLKLRAMFRLSGLFIYPVKSLGGISLLESKVESRGLQYDRRWLVVDENGVFLTQRQLPQMATIETRIDTNELILSARNDNFRVPLETEGPNAEVRIWNDVVSAIEIQNGVEKFLSDVLGHKCRLVWMPDSSERKVEENCAKNGEITSFSDGFPFLVLGQSSLDDLNLRLDEPFPANRFRTNFLFSGGEAFAEDFWTRFRIGEVEFEILKPCSRCVITTIDQKSGDKEGKEPLKTLASYRARDGQVYFAQNAVARSFGTVRVEDEIEIIKTIG